MINPPRGRILAYYERGVEHLTTPRTEPEAGYETKALVRVDVIDPLRVYGVNVAPRNLVHVDNGPARLPSTRALVMPARERRA